jgi:hypothetical protein
MSKFGVTGLRNVTPSDGVSSTLDGANSEGCSPFDDLSDSTATITCGPATSATSPPTSLDVTAPTPREFFSCQCRLMDSHSHRCPSLTRERARARHTRTPYCWMAQAKADLWEALTEDAWSEVDALMRETSRYLAHSHQFVWRFF